MINNFIKNLAIFTGISFSIFLLSFIVLAWDGPQTSPPTGNTPKPINAGTVGTSQRIEGALNVGGVLVGDTGVIPNATDQTRPTCNSSTEGMQWYDYTDNLFLGCNGTSWDYLSPPPFSCGDGFIDPRDGNVYTTVQIGTQCWMAKNLAYLPSVVPSATGSETTPYYYVYGYQGTDVATAKAQTNYTTHGVLYNHPAAIGACPSGWKLPTDAEQHILDSYLATGACDPNRNNAWGCDPAGTALKSGGSSGFNALMSGFRDTDGSFYSVGSNTYFWSSSEGGAGAWSRYLYTSDSTVRRDTYSKALGFSVRCLLE